MTTVPSFCRYADAVRMVQYKSLLSARFPPHFLIRGTTGELTVRSVDVPAMLG